MKNKKRILKIFGTALAIFGFGIWYFQGYTFPVKLLAAVCTAAAMVILIFSEKKKDFESYSKREKILILLKCIIGAAFTCVFFIVDGSDARSMLLWIFTAALFVIWIMSKEE